MPASGSLPMKLEALFVENRDQEAQQEQSGEGLGGQSGPPSSSTGDRSGLNHTVHRQVLSASH